MITFALAIVLMLATPGPGVLSAAGVGAGFGAAAGLRYVAGLCIGQALVYAAVAAGLSAFVLDTPWLRITLMAVSFLYLLYLASRIAFAGAQVAFIRSETPPGLMAGLLLQPINPKAYAVNKTFFSGFAFYPDSFLTETIIKLLILNAIWIPVHFAWLYAGNRLRSLDISAQAQRRINFLMAFCLLGVVGLSLISILGYST